VSEIVIPDRLESRAYVDMTIQALRSFGIIVQNEDYRRFVIPAGQSYQAQKVSVEGDYSQAAFFLAYNAIAGEERVRLDGLRADSLQGDRAAIGILAQYGSGEALTVDASEIPDLIPALAAAAAFRDGAETRFVNAGRLRIKESDRITVTCRMLRALGASVEEGSDFIVVQGQKALPGGGIVDCCNDHRIAMSAAVAAAGCTSGVTLLGTECVRKSYPDFWADFAALGGKAVAK
jgi:3-phosphoshikimate 1-carboxyvinyltransferase